MIVSRIYSSAVLISFALALKGVGGGAGKPFIWALLSSSVTVLTAKSPTG